MASEESELSKALEQTTLSEESEKAASPTDVTEESVASEKKDEAEAAEVKTEETEEGFETPEEGEGEDAGEEPKLDDDQDIESPAYIPKTGKYYMHDSREDTEAPREEKKSRADGMWSRDRYDPRYQQPRSRRQMIEKYGFDIRLGETKDIADVKEKEMREAGISLEDEDEISRRETNKPVDASIDKVKGHRKPQQRRDDYPSKNGKNGDNIDEEDIRPAARRDARGEDGERRSFTRGYRGESNMNREGYGRREGQPFTRGDKSRGGSARQFNRTFNNSNRGNGRDEIRERGVPKRYSAQRVDKGMIPTAANDVPTDIVYFDPAKQTPRDNRPVVREKKPLDIVSPST